MARFVTPAGFPYTLPVMAVSIIIKALNEESRIGAAIESALSALAGSQGEVIVADGGSGDRTVEIARRYPVLVVQLADPYESSCGIGPQLGYQHARGRYICLIDGDMELDLQFLRHAVRFLDTHPRCAGVAGRVIETSLDSLEFARRARRAPADLDAGEVDRLNGGGLFRREAIEEARYFTDRNLHAYEELELAARLRAHGWRLWRLEVPFVRHYGHRINAYRLLWRRWQLGYVLGLGEVVRASLGKEHAPIILRQPEIRLWAAVASSWIATILLVLLSPTWGIGLALAVLVQVIPVAVMSLRDRSFRMGLYAVAAWHVYTLGFIGGLLRGRSDAAIPVKGRILSDGRPKQPTEHGTTTAS